MATAILYDAVTLGHFAAAGQLHVLEQLSASRDHPRWCDEVKAEIERGYSAAGVLYLRDILDAEQNWLGAPVEPRASELHPIELIRIGLGGTSADSRHAGEAQSIYFAETLGAVFATDDNVAYDFAKARSGLGIGRVVDTMWLLQEAVARGDLTSKRASEIVASITDAGREIRRCHDRYPKPSEFE